jgi:thioredoxin-related protein
MRSLRCLLSAVAAALLLLLACNGAGRAALDATAQTSGSVELLVFEHADCTYCRVFRRDVLPKYKNSAPAASVPLRFVDIEKSDTSALGLKSRIHVVPTAVLMKEGNEVDRIVGYWGPDNFFKLLAQMLIKAE